MMSFKVLSLVGVGNGLCLFIYPPFQNQGLGTKVLILTEQKMKEQGYKFLQLHVFCNNKRAIHVYEKLGLEATDITMRKGI